MWGFYDISTLENCGFNVVRNYRHQPIIESIQLILYISAHILSIKADNIITESTIYIIWSDETHKPIAVRGGWKVGG